MAPIFQGVRRALRIISVILPNHTRRLVLWGTLYSKMCVGHEPTPAQFERLNAALGLCKVHKAFDLPTKLGKFISNDLDDCCLAARGGIRGEKPVELASADFVKAIPSWLRYASDAFMQRDFQKLMSSHPRLMT